MWARACCRCLSGGLALIGRPASGTPCCCSKLLWTRAANWTELGLTQGYRRTQGGYSNAVDTPKRVFVRPLDRASRARLTDPDRERLQLTGTPKTMLNAEQMRSLPQCFATLADPRRAQGRRHRLPVVPAIAAGAILCGIRGYKAISNWADGLVRIESGALDRALHAWSQAWGVQDTALAMDGKTMKNALDETGRQTHIVSLVGHDSATCYAQKSR